MAMTLDQQVVDQVQELLDLDNEQLLGEYLNQLNISDIRELIDEFPKHGHLFIENLSITRAVFAFSILDFSDQERVFRKLSGPRVFALINELPPDDRTAFFEELHGDTVKKLITLLPADERKQALTLLGYKEDSVGRLMTPDYVAVRKDWPVSKVLDHIRKYGVNSETIDVIYVIDDDGVLLDDLMIRKILLAQPDTLIEDLIDSRLIFLKANMPQEEAIEIFRLNNRVALPVVDDAGVLLGIVTIDDMLWVAQEEYAEDMQKIGGTEALDEPYLDTPVIDLFKKRVVWLVVLFLGELLTASAMGFFEDQIAKATVLALFVPLIISSGGNTGGQASTLIIQAMALGEVTLKDWWKIFRREIVQGSLLGLVLGVIGFLRIVVWHMIFPDLYGPHWFLIGLVVGLSLVGVVLLGSLTGSMLPLIMKRLGADPASSSAPFVATLVDVTGVILYFTMAILFLQGTLL